MNRSPLNEQKRRKKTAGTAAGKRKDEGKRRKETRKTSHVKKLKVCMQSADDNVCHVCKDTSCQENTVVTTGCSAIAAVIGFTRLVLRNVSWSLTSLFSTNMAISETKGQGWKVIRTQ